MSTMLADEHLFRFSYVAIPGVSTESVPQIPSPNTKDSVLVAKPYLFQCHKLPKPLHK